ncbi:MAG: hypothetical protein QM723_32190 [Myxococcaceae bacterium]
MAIHNPRGRFMCMTCRAPWSDGYWTWGCEECGGGAMSRPCGFCSGLCGGEMHRAPMDSNDSGRAEFFGKCLQPIEPSELGRRNLAMDDLAKLAGARTVELRAALCDWSNDAAWAKEPRGPYQLQVLLDAAAEKSLVVNPRLLAWSVLVKTVKLPELPALKLHGYWRSAGTLVVLEPTDQSPAPRVRICNVKRVISAARLWLTDPTSNELPCAGGQDLVAGRRYLAMVLPTNMVPGMLIEEAVETTGRESELIDLHRQLLARGEKP